MKIVHWEPERSIVSVIAKAVDAVRVLKSLFLGSAFEKRGWGGGEYHDQGTLVAGVNYTAQD